MMLFERLRGLLTRGELPAPGASPATSGTTRREHRTGPSSVSGRIETDGRRVPMPSRGQRHCVRDRVDADRAERSPPPDPRKRVPAKLTGMDYTERAGAVRA